MNKKYLNEGIIGNEKIVASFSSKGEMLRLYYPNRDYMQFIDKMYTGLKINDSNLIYLHDDINNKYEQYYTPNTNVLNTKIKNTYFNIQVTQTDFACINKDLIIKKYTLKNENNIDLNINFLIYSSLLSNTNDMVGSKIENGTLLQYCHKYTYCIFSKKNIISYKLNNSAEEINTGVIQDKDYIGMANDSAINFSIGTLKPEEEKEFEIYIYINENEKKNNIDEILKEVDKIRDTNVNKELEKTIKYWENFVSKHDGLDIFSNSKKWKEKISLDMYDKIKKVYARTILLFPLLTNSKTGGISAALETDEQRKYSGRYSYCWPRDATFITKALDILQMQDITDKFYTKFSRITQSENGMWEQRFYTDGTLAPCWGYQIDETASIVYGVYEHYKNTKNKEFLNETYEMCKKAIDSLGTFLFGLSVPFGSINCLASDAICNNSISQKNIEIFKMHESYDLWEMNEGIHLYSMAAIYSAYKAMIEIEKELERKNSNAEELEKTAEKIKEYCKEYLCNKEEKTLKRSTKDNICDISTLGATIPFNMFDIKEKQVINTIEKMNMTLRTYTNGYLRFENDSYMGGKNPWVIATLWMALYNLKTNNKEEAEKEIEFVLKTATEHGFLAEQVDNEEMKSKWVIGLGWSHAMFIITLYILSR